MPKQKVNDKKNVINAGSNKSYEIPILVFISAFLGIDFLWTRMDSGSLSYFGCLDVIAPQYLYLSVLNIIIGVYIYNNTAIISNSLLTIFKKSFLLKTYFLFLFLCGVSVLFAKNFSVSIVSFMQLLVGLFTFFNFSILLYGRLNLVFKISLLFAVNLLFLGLMQIKGIFSASDIFTGLTNFKGNTGNVNFFAASINAKIPFLLIGLLHFDGFKKWFLSFVLIIGVACVFLSGSRGAYLGLTFELLVFLIFYFKQYSFSKVSLSNVTHIVIPLLLGIFIANSIFKMSTYNPRYASVASRFSQINQNGAIPETEKNGRLAFWGNAITMISKNPIIGVGVGNWLVESTAYESKLVDNVEFSGHVHNDFLEIATESGIVNALVFITLIFSILILNLKLIWGDNNLQQKIIALLCLMLLMGYGADAMFSFPLYRPPMLICLNFMLAFSVLNSSAEKLSNLDFSYRKIILLVLLLSLAPLYFAYSNFKAYQFEKKMKDDFFKPTQEQTMTGYDIIKNAPKYPNIAIMSTEPYSRYAGILFYKKKDFAMAEKCFQESEKINSYMQVEDWFRHLMAKESGETDKAYTLVKKVFYTRPRNLAYYLDALAMAKIKKDTLEMLKIHNTYTEHKLLPSNWINTSNSLFNAGYSTKNLISFIDAGLKYFPTDKNLLERKRFFETKKTTNIFALAESYSAQLQFDKALNIYKKALIETPNDKTVLMNIGICYFKLLQYQNAINYFIKTLNATELTPGLPEYYLGISYLNLKDKNGCNYLKLAKAKNYPGIDTILQQYCN